MCELFGLSALNKYEANEYLHSFYAHSTHHPHGWGLACIGRNGALIEKESIPAYKSNYLKERLSQPIEARIMLAHIRYATIGNVEYKNCHPFTGKDNTGRRWTLIHNGTIFDYAPLNSYIQKQIGDTDSERVFLYLIDRLNAAQEKKGSRLFFEEVKSDMRAAGILLPVSSLPSPYGIGSFSESARRVIRQIRKAGQRFWQILPLGPTGYGDSPYQSFSAFAGNPYFIDLDTLLQEGLVTEEEVRTPDFGQDDESRVDYQKLYEKRFTLLKQAFERSDIASDDAFRKFCRENAFWLDDYCLFMAIKDEMGGRSWFEWPDEIRLRKAEAIADWESRTKEQADFYCFLQYKFTQQWSALKKYANELGVEVIGDIPIYVAADSSDSWSHPELFQFDEDHRPVAVAGCPPDAFSADGQLWGNPLYNWAAQEESGFAWWKERIRFCLNLYDIVRIDHFRGFDEYYSVPAGAPTAAGGHWEAGPGMKLFRALSENPAVTPRSIIAEDLGYLTPSVIKLVKDSGFPGMKVLEFIPSSIREPMTTRPSRPGTGS